MKALKQKELFDREGWDVQKIMKEFAVGHHRASMYYNDMQLLPYELYWKVGTKGTGLEKLAMNNLFSDKTRTVIFEDVTRKVVYFSRVEKLICFVAGVEVISENNVRNEQMALEIWNKYVKN